MDANLEYIRKGKTGCVFATMLSKDPEKIGWKRIFNPENLDIPNGAFIVSLIFQGKNRKQVQDWALKNGMFLEETSKNTLGLRYENENGISWVQYFGPDSHVKTRKAPVAELLFCVKLPKKYYFKVGFKGVLHLAHASIEHLSKKCTPSTLDYIWSACFKQTKKRLGHKPTVKESAKTTYLK